MFSETKTSASEIVVVENGVARFKNLMQAGCVHGYSMDGKNMSFSAPGVEGSANESVPEITNRLNDFFKKLGKDPDRVVYMDGGSSCEILFLDTPKGSEKAIEVQDRPGKYAEADAVFTSSDEDTISLKPGDCHGVFVYGKSGGKVIRGIIHAGRKQIGAGVPQKAIAALVEKYGIQPSDLLVAVTPGLGQAHHYIKAVDVPSVLKDTIDYWKEYSKTDPDGGMHINMLPALLDQITIIPETRCAVDGRDTYYLSKLGLLFSQRYSNDHKTRSGRYAMGI